MPSKQIIPADQSEPRLVGAVRRAHIPPDLSFETMSELGRDLVKLSREIVTAGEGLMSEEELEQELARRRGGYMPDGDW